MQVGSLDFEAIADTRKLLSQLKNVVNKKYTIKVEVITPKVDCTHLHELNQLLDKKQEHLKETIRFYKDNPIEATIKESEEKTAERLTSSRPTSSGGSLATSANRSTNGKTVEEELADGIFKAIERKSYGSNLAGGMIAPFKKVLTGFFEGIGHEVSKNFTSGAQGTIESYSGTSAKALGEKIGNFVLDAIVGETRTTPPERSRSKDHVSSPEKVNKPSESKSTPANPSYTPAVATRVSTFGSHRTARQNPYGVTSQGTDDAHNYSFAEKAAALKASREGASNTAFVGTRPTSAPNQLDTSWQKTLFSSEDETGDFIQMLKSQQKKAAKLREQILSKSDLKKLPQEERVKHASMMATIAQRGMASQQVLIDSIPKDQRMSGGVASQAVSLKGEFAKQLKKAEMVLAQEGIDIKSVLKKDLIPDIKLAPSMNLSSTTGSALDSFKQRGAEIPDAIALGGNAGNEHKTMGKKIAQDVLKAFDDTVERKSPPRKFKQRGKEIPDAIALGADSANEHKDAAKKIGQDMKASFDQAIGGGDSFSQKGEQIAQAIADGLKSPDSTAKVQDAVNNLIDPVNKQIIERSPKSQEKPSLPLPPRPKSMVEQEKPHLPLPPRPKSMVEQEKPRLPLPPRPKSMVEQEKPHLPLPPRPKTMMGNATDALLKQIEIQEEKIKEIANRLGQAAIAPPSLDQNKQLEALIDELDKQEELVSNLRKQLAQIKSKASDPSGTVDKGKEVQPVQGDGSPWLDKPGDASPPTLSKDSQALIKKIESKKKEIEDLDKKLNELSKPGSSSEPNKELEERSKIFQAKIKEMRAVEEKLRQDAKASSLPEGKSNWMLEMAEKIKNQREEIERLDNEQNKPINTSPSSQGKSEQIEDITKRIEAKKKEIEAMEAKLGQPLKPSPSPGSKSPYRVTEAPGLSSQGTRHKELEERNKRIEAKIKEMKAVEEKLRQDSKASSLPEGKSNWMLEMAEKVKAQREEIEKLLNEPPFESPAVASVPSSSSAQKQKDKIKEKVFKETRKLLADGNEKRSLSEIYQDKIDARSQQIEKGRTLAEKAKLPFDAIQDKALADLRKQKAKAVELERLLEEKYRILGNSSFLKSPAKYLQAKKQVKELESKIKELSEDLAQFGTNTYLKGKARQIKKAVNEKIDSTSNPEFVREGLQETPGLILSGATMLNTWSAVFGLVAPLIEPLMPILVTAMGLANIIRPHIEAIKTAIIETEPLIKRIETSVAGSLLPQGGRDEVTPQEIQAKGKEELDYVKQIAKEQKISLKPAISNYSKLAIAANRTKLEGEGVKELFEGISASVRAMRLSTAETDLVFTAYVQMLSKGKINMEELRQQLGEKFPPAMNIFSKALGVSTAEFDALSRKGALLSEDVLGKVSKVLKADYGNISSIGSDYIGALNKLEGATFEFQTAVAASYSGLFSGITNIFAKMTNLVASQFPIISKAIMAALIGIGAQVGISIAMIARSGAIAKGLKNAQFIILASFKASMVALMPFLVGVFADIAGDLLGAENTIIQNMTNGMNNLGLSIGVGLQSALYQITGKGFSTEKVKAPDEKESGIKKVMAKAKLPSGVIELAALTLMLEQAATLMKLFIAPQIAKVTSALAGMAQGFALAFKPGQNLSNMMGTLFTESAKATTALGFLKGALMNVAMAYAIISFSRSDFGDKLMDSFKKAEKSIVTSIYNIRKELENLTPPSLDTPGQKGEIVNKLPSKGLELNPKAVLGMGGESFKSDDLINEINKPSKDKGLMASMMHSLLVFAKKRSIAGFLEDLRGESQIETYRKRASEFGLSEYFGSNQKLPTLAQEQLLMQARKGRNIKENVYNQLTESRIAPHQLKRTGIPKEILATVKEINAMDAQIGELGKRKFALTITGTPEAKKEIGEIREKIRTLFLQRTDKASPIKNMLGDLETAKLSIENSIKDIETTEGYSSGLKEKLKIPFVEAKQYIEETMAAMKEGGVYTALDALGDKWKEIISTLKDADLVSEKTARTNTLSRLSGEKEIYTNYKTARGASAAIEGNEIKYLKAEQDRLQSYAESQRQALQDLLSIPQIEENQERADEIEQLKKDLNKSEDDLAQAQVNLAKSVQARAIAIREFNMALIDLSTQPIQLYSQTKQYSVDRKIKTDPLLNEELAGTNQQIRMFARSTKDSLRQQIRGLQDFILSVEDFARSLKTTIAALDKQAKEIKNNIAKINLDASLSFYSSAGIQNMVVDFFSKITEIATRASDIANSDARPQLQKDLEESQRSYERFERDNQRKKEDLSFSLDSSKFDSKTEVERLNREIMILEERRESEGLDGVVQGLNLAQQYRNYNRQVDESREVGKAYGVRVNLSKQEIPEILTKESLDESYSAFQAIKEQVIQGKKDLIQAYKDKAIAEEKIYKEGLAKIEEAEKEARETQLELKKKNLEAQKIEGDRIIAENNRIAQGIKGTYVALQKSLKYGEINITLDTNKMALGNKELFNSIPDNNAQATNVLNDRLVSLRSQRDDLTAFIDSSQLFLDPKGLIKQISGLKMDDGIKQELIAKLANASDRNQIQDIISAYKNQRKVLISQIDELETKGPEYQSLASKRAKIDNQSIVDSKYLDLSSSLKESQFLSPFESDSLGRESGALTIESDYKKQILDLESLAIAGKITSEQLMDMQSVVENTKNIKLDNLIQQTDTWGQLLNKTVESGFSSFVDSLRKDITDLGGAFKALIDSLLEGIASFASELAKNQILKLINGKDNAVGLKPTEPSQGGGGIGGFLSNFLGAFFKDGYDGTQKIPNYANGYSNALNLGLGMQNALKRENHPKAFPAIINADEVVLSAKGGDRSDAAMFKRLKASNAWERYKASYSPSFVSNYSSGKIDKMHSSLSQVSNRSTFNKSQVTNNYNYNLSGGLSDRSSRETERQRILREKQERQRTS